MMECDPDWAPSLNLGHMEVQPTNEGRFQRAMKRATRSLTSTNPGLETHSGNGSVPVLDNAAPAPGK